MILVFTACSSKTEESNSIKEQSEPNTAVVHGDLREKTAKGDILSSFLKEKPESMKYIYNSC